MSVEKNNGRSKFTVTREEEIKVASYSVTEDKGEEGNSHAGDKAREENALQETAGESGDKKDTADKSSSSKGEGIVSIPANNTPKKYEKEFIYIALLVVLCAAGALLAYFVATYKYAGIILAVLSLLAAAALVKHVYESKKVSELVTSGKCKTVTELMSAMKKTKRADFLRTIGGMIKDGHLTGYALLDDEYFVCRNPENADR